MGNLGFTFQIENQQNFSYTTLTLNKKPLQYPTIIVFIQTPQVKGNIIVSTTTFKKEESHSIFFDQYYDIKKFIFLQNIPCKYAQVRLSPSKMIDYEYLTFWFPTKQYLTVRNLLLIRTNKTSLHEELKERISHLKNLFF